MNMISTGAFQTEMDASNNQPTIAEKFAAVWEKKNAKAARAGGVSLMALSLAACGSSDDDATATTADTTADTTTTTPVAPVAPTAVSKTFTTNLDALEGGAGNDTFSGVYYADGGTGTTAFPGDSVSAGEGTDTLNISVAGLSTVAQNINAIRTTGVETLLVTNFDTNADDTEDTTVDTSLMTGLTSVGLNASSANGDTAFSNMTAIIDASMANGSADMTMTYIATVVAGAADTQNLSVSNVTAGAFTANGAETIAITTSTVKSTLTSVASDTMTKLTVAGDQALKITTALATKTIDASASTGDVTLTLAANAAHVVTGGSGADTIDAVGTLSNADTIAGGAGADTLKLSVGNATINQGTAAAKGELYNVSGFETIDISSTHDNATLNLKSTTGVTAVDLGSNVKTLTVTGSATNTAAETIALTINGTSVTTASTDFTGNAAADVVAANASIKAAISALSGFTATAGTTGAITITADTGEAIEVAVTAGSANTATYVSNAYKDATVSNIGSQTLNILSADAVTASLADASGTSDALSVNLNTVAADTTFAKSVGTITANNIETINMDASGMGNGKATTVAALTGNSIGTLNITGDSDVIFTAFTSSTKLANIDASASTGDISLAAAPVAAAVGGSTIKTGGGNDTITMAATLTAADVIDAGGNNIPLNGTLLGSDTVTATGNIGTVTAASGLQIANAEAINITNTGAAATYIDAAKITGTSTMSFSAASGTVKLTNLGSHHTVGAAIAADEFDGTLNLGLADATGTADSVTIDYGTGADTASTVALTVAAAVETVNIKATTEALGADTFAVTNTNNAAKNIVITKGHVADTMALGTLNAATTNVDASAAAGTLTMTSAAGGAVTVSASGAATTLHNIVTGAGNDTVTLSGLTAAAVNIINGNGGTGDTLNMSITSAATDFTSVSGFETLNLTVGANTQAGFNNGTKDNGLNLATVVNILGGDSLSTFTLATGVLDDDAAGTTMTFDASLFGGTTSLAVASDAFDAELNIKGGVSTTDAVSIIVAGVDNKVASMSGIETLTINSTNSDAGGATTDVTNATGLVTIDAKFTTGGAAELLTVNGIAAGTKIKTTMTETGDNLVLGLASATGTSDTITLEVTDNGVNLDVLNLDAVGVETLALTMKDTAHSGTIDVAGLTATGASGTSTITVVGAGATVFNGINATTDTIDASAATGAQTILAAQRTADAKTIKGGTANDTFAMESASDVLSGNLGTDTLIVDYTAVMGGIAVDLTAADQVTTFESSANASVQSGFENVNLSAYDNFGATVVGTDLANTITGTAKTDNISGGKGDDIINITSTAASKDDIMNGGAGTGDAINIVATTDFTDTDGNIINIENVTIGAGSVDVVLTGQSEAFTITGGTGANVITGGTAVDTITTGTGADTVVLTVAGGVDVVTDFTAGVGGDKFQDTATEAITSNDVTFAKLAANASAYDVAATAGVISAAVNVANAATMSVGDVNTLLGTTLSKTISAASDGEKAILLVSTDFDSNLVNVHAYIIEHDGTDFDAVTAFATLNTTELDNITAANFDGFA
jgi:hypothetical protein